MTRLPTKEEWEMWLDSPETKAFRQIAAARRQTLKDSWESGAYNDPLINAKFIGESQAYRVLEDLNYESIIEGELADHDEYKRTETPGQGNPGGTV